MAANEFVLVTDVTSDLTEDFCRENNIKILFLSFTLDDVEYTDSSIISPKAFYDKMREGKTPKTSQITPEAYEKHFSEILDEGKDILYIAFSSGLSGSFNSAKIAVENLKEKYPDQNIRVVDSLCASLGEGLFVYYVLQQKKMGKSLDEAADWAEENKLNICHMFTVDDLIYLHRGGRVSKATAIAGSILGIKPVLHVDNNGKLVPIGKVRGRKQSLAALVDEMAKRIGEYKNDIIAISHGDSEEDAKVVQKLVHDRFGINSCIMNYVGTVIGSHSGPGTIALFFMGEIR